MGTEVDVPDSQLPPSSVRQVHFTCGPSRTEAEHPQSRFGKVKMNEGGAQPVLPAPAGTTTTEAAATKSAATTEPATTAAEILESALSFLG